MLQIVDSDIELYEVDITEIGDTGIADVYLNKDIISFEDDEGQTHYSATQAYMQYGIIDDMEETFSDNFDVYFEIAQEWEPDKPLTAEQRISAIEDCLLELSEVLYAE